MVFTFGAFLDDIAKHAVTKHIFAFDLKLIAGSRLQIMNRRLGTSRRIHVNWYPLRCSFLSIPKLRESRYVPNITTRTQSLLN